MTVTEQDDVLLRLQRALAPARSHRRRPLTRLELPEEAAHLLSGAVLADLAPAAVLLPLFERPAGLSVLFTVRSQALRSHAGQISLPGGRAEEVDDGPVDTALRETHEEIALAPDRVDVLGLLDDYPTVSGFRITPVVGLVESGATFTADGVEVAETFEVPLSHLADAANYERRHIRRQGLQLPYYAIAYGQRFIWGATAGILRELVRKLEAAE